MIKQKSHHFHTLLAELGVAFYILTFGFDTNPDYSLIVLAFCSAVLALFFTGNERTTPFTPAVILFLIALAVSSGLSIDVDRSLQLSLALLPALLLYFIISTHISGQQISHIFLLMVIFSVFTCLYLILSNLGHEGSTPQQWIERADFSFFKVPNDIVFPVLISPFAFAFAYRNFKSLNGFFSTVSIILCAYVSIKCQSRLAILLMLMSAFLTGLLLLETRIVFQAATGLILVFFIIDAISGFSILKKLWHHPWGTRFPLWLAAGYMFLNAPIIGNGPGSFLLLYREKLQLHGQMDLLILDPRTAPWAHNMFLEILAEIGIAGLIPILLIFAISILKLLRIVIHHKNSDSEAVPVFVSWVCFFTAGFFELSLWRQWVFIYFFILAGITVIILSSNDFMGVKKCCTNIKA